MVSRVITSVRVVDVQKRKVPSKHYVYIISVTWCDSSVNVVYRRYSKFFDLQTKLIEEFPKEGGVHNPSARVLPFLPGKIIFGRSHVRDVAMKRMEPINDYCEKLIALEPKISQCDLVLKFFEPEPEDIEIPGDKKKEKKRETADVISDPMSLEQFVAIADYKKQNLNEINMVAGDVVEIIDKNENGWWFVNLDEEQGWIPAAYLEPVDGQTNEMICTDVTSIEDNQFITSASHKAELDDELSFEKGVIVSVLKKNFDGWWLISYQDKEGWAPAMYLKKPDPMQLRAAELGGGLPRTSSASKHVVMQQRTSSNAGAKGKKGLPPRKASVKRSLNKTPALAITNQSYERSFEPVKERKLLNPEAEYFTLEEFRAVGIQSGLDFDQGEAIEVLDKSPNGWWLGKIGGQEGWIPSSYIGKREKSDKKNSPDSKPKRPELPSAVQQPQKAKPEKQPNDFKNDLAAAIGSVTLRKSSNPKEPVSQGTAQELYVAICNFEDSSDGVVSLKEGDVLEVIDKSEGEWWLIKLNNKEGWTPASYLKKKEGPLATRPKPPASKVDTKPKPIPSQKPTKASTLTSKPQHAYDKPAFPAKPAFPVKPVIKDTPATVNTKEKPKVTDPLGNKKIGKLNTAFFESKIQVGPPQPEEKQEKQNKSERPIKKSPLPLPRPHTPSSAAEREKAVEPPKGKKAARREPPPPPSAKHSFSKPAKPDPPKPAKRDSPKPARPVPPSKPVSSKPHKQLYVAVATFADEDEVSASFQEGDTMEVLEQHDGGWWYVKVGNDCGWAPSNYITPVS